MTLDPRVFQELGIVTRIDDGVVDEVSNVDDPATDIEFAMFKAIEKAPGLADVEACLRDGIATPTECQAQSEGWGDLLRADVRIQDSGTKGEPMEKIEALAGEAPPPPVEGDVAPAAGPEPIEIPATPVDWPLSKCIDAGVKMNLTEDQAGQACMLLREQYGAAGEDGKLLIPDGVKPEALLGAAAADLGFAVLGGKATTPKRSAPDPKAYKGIGTHWKNFVDGFLGVKPKPGEELARYLKSLSSQNKALAAKVEELVSEQTKTREDLRLAVQMADRANRRMVGLLAGALNVQMPDDDEMDDAPATPAPAPAEPQAHPLEVGGKRAQKCDAPAAPAAEVPATEPVAEEAKAEAVAAPTDSERITRLEMLIEQLIAGGPVDGGGMEPEGDEFEQIAEEELIAETLAAAGATVPGKRASAVSPLLARRAQIKADILGGLNGGLPKGYSRGFTGMVIADADREAVRRTRSVTGLHIKR